jgi:hypothetical protein
MGKSEAREISKNEAQMTLTLEIGDMKLSGSQV